MLKYDLFLCLNTEEEQMKNDEQLPKIDISEDFLIVTEFDIGTLNLYTNYPCRIKAQVFIFCLSGEMDAELNMVPYAIKANDFVTVIPDSIIQIKRVTEDLKLYILLYSSRFVETITMLDTSLMIIQTVRERPVINISAEMADIFNDYCNLIKKICRNNLLPQTVGFYKNVLYTISYVLQEVYGQQQWEEVPVTRGKTIVRLFERHVFKFYKTERSVSFYAAKLGVTAQHLCNTVKQETGETVTDIINKYIILEAKAQIKTTNLSIRSIAYSLNFSNVSFFGKFFKKHVGLTPVQYRNS